MGNWIFVGLLFFAVGCGKSPFPKEGLTRTKPPPRKTVPQYQMRFKRVMEFTEGLQYSYQIAASVPPPGTATVEVKDLPEGASFDRAKGMLTWKPSRGFVGASGRSFTLHEIKIIVTSSEQPGESLTEVATLLVSREK